MGGRTALVYAQMHEHTHVVEYLTMINGAPREDFLKHSLRGSGRIDATPAGRYADVSSPLHSRSPQKNRRPYVPLSGESALQLHHLPPIQTAGTALSSQDEDNQNTVGDHDKSGHDAGQSV